MKSDSGKIELPSKCYDCPVVIRNRKEVRDYNTLVTTYNAVMERADKEDKSNAALLALFNVIAEHLNQINVDQIQVNTEQVTFACNTALTLREMLTAFRAELAKTNDVPEAYASMMRMYTEDFLQEEK
jgi:hypothetical protein